MESRDPHDTGRGLGDPDAGVGRGKKGFSLGYQSLFLTDIEGLPLGHEEASANVNEKQLVEPLLDRLLGEDLEVSWPSLTASWSPRASSTPLRPGRWATSSRGGV